MSVVWKFPALDQWSVLNSKTVLEETFGFRQSTSTLTQDLSTSPKNCFRTFPLYSVVRSLLIYLFIYLFI